MPRSRSRSRSPRRDERRRSRSPRCRDDRDTDQPRRKHGGFRWKEKRRGDEETGRTEGRGLERGYRESYRPRDRYDRDGETSTAQSDRGTDRDRPSKDREEKGDADKKEKKEKKKEKKEKKEKKAQTTDVYIVVHVNDRLGTKAAIPCLPSDPIYVFKAQVAAQIGREPHEILLKRQGERPFKDQLTLEDYGVSNGVQLDLEVDTGD